MADASIEICRLCVMAGICFSVENLAGSYLFDYMRQAGLGDLCDVYMINFCQCAYGLRFPDTDKFSFCRKNTFLMTNMQSLRQLERKCPGISPSHKHVHAQGTCKVEGRTVRRSALAGHYPLALCQAWCRAAAESGSPCLQ